jgi:hypothetical protein
MRIFTTGQFGWLLKKPAGTILRWIKEGKLPHLRIGKFWFVSLTEEELSEIAKCYGVKWEDIEKVSLKLGTLKEEELRKLLKGLSPVNEEVLLKLAEATDEAERRRRLEGIKKLLERKEAEDEKVG